MFMKNCESNAIHTIPYKTALFGDDFGENFGEENTGSCKDIKRKGTSKWGIFSLSLILCIEQTGLQKMTLHNDLWKALIFMNPL